MLARLPLALVAGLAGGFLFVAMVMLGPILGTIPWLVAPMPVIAAGLLLGWSGALVAGTVAVVALALMSLNPALVGLYLMSDALPALVILWLALRPAPGVSHPDPRRPEHWGAPGRILVWLTVLSATGLLLAAMVAGGPLADPVRVTVEQVVDDMAALSADATVAEAVTDPAVRGPLVESLVSVIPGAMAMVWTIRAALAGVLAMALVSRLGRPVRPRPVYSATRVPAWYGVLFAAVLAMSMLGGEIGYVAWSATVALSLPFVVLGLKLVHLVARKTPAPGVLLVVFYVVLFASAIGLVAVVFAGLVEFATDLRRDAGGRSMEDE
ncbi:DUF2232 domain-containing protein [Roseospira visakhapatnamensis]|uniref:DUF2232 domain-containing protein n=1 Tax=Roseospira visakhapatnamensis TaxID=390880 RepID=A0A7W6RBB3_9PROT|nr:DUF2232 domain-containing protein [Roseospira visakhapatnamensis]MBB4265312.1 hypothetical protein [Roseospira visakhapatnamensis]